MYIEFGSYRFDVNSCSLTAEGLLFIEFKSATIMTVIQALRDIGGNFTFYPEKNVAPIAYNGYKVLKNVATNFRGNVFMTVGTA